MNPIDTLASLARQAASLRHALSVTLVSTLFVTPLHGQEMPSQICAGTDAIEGAVTDLLEAGTRVLALTTSSGDHPEGGGLYLSCNGGDDWFKHPEIPAGGLAIAKSPDDETNLYVAGGGGFVYVSHDGGDTWEATRPVEFGNISVSALTALPGGKVMAGMDNGRLLESTDYGSVWTPLDSALPAESIHAIAVNPSDSNQVLLAVGDSGVFQSLDGGQDFAESRFPGALLPPAYWPVRDVSFQPGDTSRAFAGSNGGLWQSVDGGYEFSAVADARNIVDLRFGERDPDTLFLVSEFSGLLLSDHYGESLSLVAPDLPRSTDWYSGAIQLSSGRLLLGTVLEGLYRSDDEGMTWQVAGAAPAEPPPPAPTGTVSMAASLSLDLQNLNGPEAIEYGTRARFRVTVRNNGPDASTGTYVSFLWIRPNTNGAPSPAFTLTSSSGSCTVTPNSNTGCNLGTLAVGQSATINFEGSTSRDYIGEHRIIVTARNAQHADVTRNGTVSTKRTVYCIGDCDDGGGGSMDVLMLVGLFLLTVSRLRLIR